MLPMYRGGVFQISQQHNVGYLILHFGIFLGDIPTPGSYVCDI